MKQLTLTILGAAFALQTLAQTENTMNPKWGVEFNLIWPFVPGVEIYTAKATKTIWSNEKMHGDILAGALVRPNLNNDENADIFREFGVALGYRQYFIKGFHVDAMIYPSYAMEIRNKIDGRNHSGFALTTELYTGYRFDLLQRNRYSLYLLPQTGIGYNAIARLGPTTETSRPFPVLSLLAGIRF